MKNEKWKMENEGTGETDGRGKPLPYDIEGASGVTVGAGLAPPADFRIVTNNAQT